MPVSPVATRRGRGYGLVPMQGKRWNIGWFFVVVVIRIRRHTNFWYQGLTHCIVSYVNIHLFFSSLVVNSTKNSSSHLAGGRNSKTQKGKLIWTNPGFSPGANCEFQRGTKFRFTLFFDGSMPMLQWSSGGFEVKIQWNNWFMLIRVRNTWGCQEPLLMERLMWNRWDRSSALKNNKNNIMIKSLQTQYGISGVY